MKSLLSWLVDLFCLRSKHSYFYAIGLRDGSHMDGAQLASLIETLRTYQPTVQPFKARAINQIDGFNEALKQRRLASQ